MDAASRRLLSHKIKTAEEVAESIGPRPRARKVILCHGTFDVVHPGHVRHLIYAKTKADVLVASLTADEHVRKGNLRPYVPEELRAFNLAALEMVDYVIVDRDPTPLRNLATIEPDYFAKGYEYQAGGLHPKTQDEMTIVHGYGGEMIFTPDDVVYSSSALIESQPPAIAVEKLMALLEAEGSSFEEVRSALSRLPGIRVHVVGDAIVDSHTYCTPIGGIGKTPTMSVRFDRRVDYTGGAAIVAKHLRAAGAEVTFSTVLGDDALRKHILDDLGASGVVCHAVIDPGRPTTNKNAIVAGGYRLLKVDTLDNRPISAEIRRRIERQITDTPADAVVMSDFRHGVFSRETVPPLVAAVPTGAFTAADSQVASRWGNILEFQGFDLLVPNEREARFALGDQDSPLRPLAEELFLRARCRTLLLKCGERGMVARRTATDGRRPFFAVDTFADRVADAVGAGDAFLAYATLAMVATGREVIAAVLGSIAAGVECERDGNHPVTPNLVSAKLDAIESRARFV